MCTVLLPPGEDPIAVNKYILKTVSASWTFIVFMLNTVVTTFEGLG
jgi:hypothetical protein